MDLSVVEQRYRAVLAVERGEPKIVVAAQFGVSRQTLHSWLTRYRALGLAGLMDRSHRPETCPHRADAQIETRVCELRREHPWWGPRRIAFELARSAPEGSISPGKSTVHRILRRHGLIEPNRRRRKRRDYVRWERQAPMALWQLDIVGGLFLADGTECKVVTGVDDHSRFCVIAAVVVRATGRAVCLAFAEALRRYGVPDEVLTDNGKQFTARFGKGGEVLFDGFAATMASPTDSPSHRPPRLRGKWSVSSAPRGALSHPRFSREELGGRFLGLMAYLALKG